MKKLDHYNINVVIKAIVIFVIIFIIVHLINIIIITVKSDHKDHQEHHEDQAGLPISFCCPRARWPALR